MKNISESLAGRALYFKMFPLTLNEMTRQLAKPNALKILFQGNIKKLGDEIVRTDYSQLILTGLLPKMLELKNLENKLLWLENFVYQHLIALSQQFFPKPLIYHWRTTDGLEVDFILEQGRNILAVEVKSKDNVRFNDCKNLVEFIKQYKNCKLGILIYSGNKVIKLSDKIYAVPIGSL